MKLDNEIEDDVNLFDVVDSQELVDVEDAPPESDKELDFENNSFEGYEEMVEAEDKESDILE